MNNDDIKKLRGVIREEVTASEQRLEHRLERNLRTELTQVIRVEVTASEQRLEEKLGAKIKQLGEDIGNFISEQILPQIAEKADKIDIERLERKIDRIIEKDIGQDNRLDRIESISAIALELKKPSKKH